MKIIRDYQFVNTSDRGASVAVGNFDGVHLGHQHVIEIARVWGKKNKSPLGFNFRTSSAIIFFS